MPEISRKEREKRAREDEILDAAEKIFGSVGYEGAMMEEIAREAQFTRKTLYQYFGSKEELLSAVILRGFGLLLERARQSAQGPGSGYERLRSMGRAFYAFYSEHTDFFGLINYSARMKSIGKEEQRSGFEEIDRALFEIVSDVIESGKADGSIRSGLDTAMATASIMFAMTGFFVEYSLTGKSFTQHLSLDGDTFVLYSLDLLLGGIETDTVSGRCL